MPPDYIARILKSIASDYESKEKKMHEIEEDPLFLRVKSRDTVLVGEDEICKVLSFVGGARDPDALHFF